MTEPILEGPHDPHTFRAIFMAGSPGAGKTTVARHVLAGTGLKHVNVDQLVEHLAKKRQLDLSKPHVGDPYNRLYKDSFYKNRTRVQIYVDGGLGLLIDGTARDFNRIVEMKGELEEMGYSTMMVFVSTPLEVALQRNSNRERVADPTYVEQAWKNANTNKGRYQALFGHSRFIDVDNSTRSADFSQLTRHVRRFLQHQPKRELAVAESRRPSEHEHTNNDTWSQAKVEEIAQTIFRECQPYLNARTPDRFVPTPLFRGSDSMYQSVFITAEVRPDRNPRDTGEDLHKAIVQSMTQAGIKAHRGNSAFCSGAETMAAQYGSIGVVYPVGDFDYSWSPHIDDMMTYIDGTSGDPEAMWELLGYSRVEVEELRRRLASEFASAYRSWLKREGLTADPSWKSLITAAARRALLGPFSGYVPWTLYTQLMTAAGVKTPHTQVLDVFRQLTSAVQRDVLNKSSLGVLYKQTDLEEAIRSGHEIMIRCTKLHMVSEQVHYRVATRLEELMGDKK